MVRICVLACLAIALAGSGTAASTITRTEDTVAAEPRATVGLATDPEQTEEIEPALLYGQSLILLLEPDDPLRLLADLKLGGEVVLTLPVDPDSDEPWMVGLTPLGTSTKFAAIAAENAAANGVTPAHLAAVALGGLGLLGLSLVLWRRSVRRSRRRSSRRRNGDLQPA